MSNYGRNDNDDEHLAYGDYPEGNGSGETDDGGERGVIGDTWRRFQGRGRHDHEGGPGNQEQQSGNAGSSTSSSLLGKLHHTVHGLGSEIASKIGGEVKHSHTHLWGQCDHGTHETNHRFQSFAPQRDGNDAKWYVDACGYMWAVSRALETASQSIWILDWWLSPELYLRRPPARNEQYRVDRMLQAAAQRGVKVNIIVYKEVTQALTRKYLLPMLPDYLHSLLPRSTHPSISMMSRLGLEAIFRALDQVEADSPLIPPPLTVSSSHTKHALEDLHPNICVFRHPDHLPDAQSLQSSFLSSLQNMSLNAATAAKLPSDALKAIYGMNEEVVLYWAHHEKLLLVDGHVAFMGGLDLCYGRWDTNQHSIADAHPANIEETVFPGQDFNNARVMDFDDVVHYQNNKLDRTTMSRMGWSDVALSLQGPVVEDLRMHFVDRWNYIFNDKYDVRKDDRYSRLTLASGLPPHLSGHYQGSQQQYQPHEWNQHQQGEPRPEYQQWTQRGEDMARDIKGAVSSGIHQVQDRYQQGGHSATHQPPQPRQGSIPCQIVRSCTKWSHGVPTEHSIANAYIEVIQRSQHFVYIENQFFITATSDRQKPVKNKIGAAIVERILRAARERQRYKVVVVMPAVPAFAGDLKDDSALGTRAIMEFQYNSINRGGSSIMESIAKEGIDPTEYIRFYNLRNYDRINSSAVLRAVQQKSGVLYDDARRQHDDILGAGYAGRGEETAVTRGNPANIYQQYQYATQQLGSHHGLASGRWDSVSECYMLHGEDIRNVPWEDGVSSEMDAFVSEELYIHSKVIIADDRTVICGSANLNDRSQLGDHDSEIAIVIEDPTPLDSRMAGTPWQASKYAATLRRQIFRKHLGLLPSQDMQRPDQNYEPIGVPNVYDSGSAEDRAVEDPLSDEFLGLWNTRARVNTEAFGRLFHPVPHDSVKSWKDYETFFEQYFHQRGEGDDKQPSRFRYGHVVADEFSPGQQGVAEMKEVLSTIRGTLVEMPLLFLIDEDIAKEGLSLNAFTEEIYT